MTNQQHTRGASLAEIDAKIKFKGDILRETAQDMADIYTPLKREDLERLNTEELYRLCHNLRSTMHTHIRPLLMTIVNGFWAGDANDYPAALTFDDEAIMLHSGDHGYRVSYAGRCVYDDYMNIYVPGPWVQDIEKLAEQAETKIAGIQKQEEAASREAVIKSLLGEEQAEPF